MIINININIEPSQDEINLHKNTHQFWNPIKVYNQHKPNLKTQEKLT